MTRALPADVLHLIASAVTPVVMISAAALLINGIANKHQSMSDRVRNLAAERRNPAIGQSRLNSITIQLPFFRRRLAYAANAQRLLYLAIVAFLLTIFLIVLAPTGFSWSEAVYFFFIAGVVLMLVAVTFEFAEFWWSNKTIQAELSDIET